MFVCLFLKKKIFEHAQGALEARQAEKLSRHMGKCARCKKLFREYKTLLAGANLEKPFLGEVFWRKFDTNLELLLSEQNRPAQRLFVSPFAGFRLDIPRAALATALTVCLIFAVFFGPLKDRFTGSEKVAAVSEDKIIETAMLLDDLGEPAFGLEEDELIEEYLLQISLEDV